ncbi:hypothetical protein D3C78_1443090 [compost metagenome]
MRATAGDGQKNREVTSIIRPMPQKANAGVLRNRVKGAIMISFIPVRMRTRLIATMMDMIRIVPINSLMA